VCVCVCVSRSIRVQFSSQAVFQRNAVNDFGLEDISRIVGYIHSTSIVVTQADPLDLNAVARHFRQRVEQFSQRGSGYTLQNIYQLSASFIKYRPLGAAGSYIPTPTWIKNKRAVINVQNRNDSRCFVWSLLAALYLARDHHDRCQNHAKYENRLNLANLEFPLSVKHIPIFEAQNPSIAIHCIAVDSRDKSLSILYLSPHVTREITL